MNIAIYSRKSKLTESGESIKNQMDLCKEYAYKHFQVDNLFLYEDEGYSGSNVKRPKYQKMIKAAKNKSFNILICYRLDRVSRNVLDFSHTLEILTMNNIEFISIRDHFDTSTPMGRAMMYIASVFAQLERETIAERVKDNMYKLAETGQWLGGITPLGYTSSRIMNESSGKSIAILSNIAEEEKLIQLIFDKYEELGSLIKLQLYTLHHQLKTRKKCDFSLSSLKNILTNPVYMEADHIAYQYFQKNQAIINNRLNMADFNGSYGIMAFNKHDEQKNKIVKKDMKQWIIAIGLHRPIISSTQWIKVQKMLLDNSCSTSLQTDSKTALLPPLITCKNCGVPLKTIGKYKDKHLKYFYYKCRIKESSHNMICNINNLNGYKAENLILNALEQYLSTDELIQTINRSLSPSKTDYDVKQKERDIQKSIQTAKEGIHRLTTVLSKNRSSASSKYIVQEIEKMDTQLKSLNQQLLALTSEDTRMASYNLVNQINKTQLHHLLSFEQKKRLINKIIKNISWDGLNLEIEFTF